MITYCSRCGVNWSALWQQEAEGEEVYEFCPLCKTDLHLEEGNDIHGHIKCPVSGKIYNTFTGEDVTLTIMAKPVSIKERKVKVWDETYEEFKKREEDAEDAYVAGGEYIQPVRKFHYQ